MKSEYSTNWSWVKYQILDGLVALAGLALQSKRKIKEKEVPKNLQTTTGGAVHTEKIETK